MNYTNTPPKEIQNILWGMFDYKDFDTVVDGVTVRDRVYSAWQSMHNMIKESDKAEPGWFMKFLNENQVEIEPTDVEIITLSDWQKFTFGPLRQDYAVVSEALKKYCAENNVHYYSAEKHEFFLWRAQAEAASAGRRKVIVENLS